MCVCGVSVYSVFLLHDRLVLFWWVSLCLCVCVCVVLVLGGVFCLVLLMK